MPVYIWAIQVITESRNKPVFESVSMIQNIKVNLETNVAFHKKDTKKKRY